MAVVFRRKVDALLGQFSRGVGKSVDRFSAAQDRRADQFFQDGTGKPDQEYYGEYLDYYGYQPEQQKKTSWGLGKLKGKFGSFFKG